jgi:hypothetical protein
MPIIQFTDSDKLAAITADAGFYQAVVKEMDMKASGSGKSVNFWTTFEITQEGKYKGKEIKCCFNSEVNNSSMLGGTQFRPQSDILVLAAAILGVTLQEVSLSLNTDDLLLKGFDLQVGVDVAEGLPVNNTGNFVPLGKATSAEAQKVAF